MTSPHDPGQPAPPDPWLDKPHGAPSWAPHIDDDRSMARLWWLIGLVLAAGVIAFLVRGANRPADPTLAGGTAVTTTSLSATPSAGRTLLPGFGEVAVDITDGDRTLERCLLLASTDEQRARGLMAVTDTTLGGYDGMLFRFDADVMSGFYMRNTPMPLSIAFLDVDGKLINDLDMAPCADVPNCTIYDAARAYRYALEVPQGQLPTVGITTTSVLHLKSGPCEANA